MKIIMALSGGLDSATLLAHHLTNGDSVIPVSFKYGSKHNDYERFAASEIAAHYKLELLQVDATKLFKHTRSDLLMTGGDIPEGHYKAENMKSTIVPGRNLIFISIMASIAETLKFDALALGVHAGDHHIYPDCREEFIGYTNQAVRTSSDGQIKVIMTPFIHATKKDIVYFAKKLSVPLHLTRTCYKDQPVACGKCGSCIERLEAFKLNNLVDPAQYESEPSIQSYKKRRSQ